jgi:hypothetical protein
MTLAESIDHVHVYWARQLAITPTMLLSSQLSLVPHPEASTGSYIMVFQHHSLSQP